MSAGLIEMTGLTRRYGDGTVALDDVNLTVSDGEWLAVTGPSGSGKTTLLNIIGGLDRPNGGTVIVGGVDVARLSRRELALYRRQTVGLVFQQFFLVPYLTALENVMLAQYFHSMADAAEAAQVLRHVGLGDRLRHLPSQLSGGEQQRVCIARALINEPSIILADEPTGNLDKANEQTVMEIFQESHRQGRTIVLVTHAPAISGRADKVIALDHGRVLAGQPVLSR
jgi:putative ABC transport system ATP-binding protein